jgi:uncharacterized protein YceK
VSLIRRASGGPNSARSKGRGPIALAFIGIAAAVVLSGCASTAGVDSTGTATAPQQSAQFTIESGTLTVGVTNCNGCTITTPTSWPLAHTGTQVDSRQGDGTYSINLAANGTQERVLIVGLKNGATAFNSGDPVPDTGPVGDAGLTQVQISATANSLSNNLFGGPTAGYKGNMVLPNATGACTIVLTGKGSTPAHGTVSCPTLIVDGDPTKGSWSLNAEFTLTP